MAQASGKKLAGWQKALLWVVGGFVVWRVAISDSIGNGLLGFFLGGEVPGTDMVLPPEVILFGTLGVAICIVLVVGARMWAGHRRVRHFRALADKSVYTAVEPESAAVVVPATVAKSEPKKVGEQPVVAAVPLSARARLVVKRVKSQTAPWLQRTGKRLHGIGGRIGMHAIGLYELARIGILYGGRWLGRQVISLAKLIKRTSLRVYRLTHREASAFKQAAGPYTKRLVVKTRGAITQGGQWLRKQFHRSVRVTHKLIAAAKRAYRKSPIPSWVTAIQRWLRSSSLSDK